MIEEIRNWLRTCPLIDQSDRFNVNYLSQEPLAFSVEETPSNAIARRYMDGSTLRAKTWVLAAVQDYSPDVLAQIGNSGFWEQFSAWVEPVSYTHLDVYKRQGRSTGRSTVRSIGRSTGRSTGRSMGRSTGRSTGRGTKMANR